MGTDCIVNSPGILRHKLFEVPLQKRNVKAETLFTFWEIGNSFSFERSMPCREDIVSHSLRPNWWSQKPSIVSQCWVHIVQCTRGIIKEIKIYTIPQGWINCYFFLCTPGLSLSSFEFKQNLLVLIQVFPDEELEKAWN